MTARRSQWPRGLRRRSAAARLRLWVRIPPGAWMSRECCVLGRGLCIGLFIRPEESCRLWYIIVCDIETLWMRSRPTRGPLQKKKRRGVHADQSEVDYSEGCLGSMSGRARSGCGCLLPTTQCHQSHQNKCIWNWSNELFRIMSGRSSWFPTLVLSHRAL